MTEIERKNFISYCFERIMAEEELQNLPLEKLNSVFLPSSFNSVHDSNRVILFDRLKDVIIRYFNLNEANNGHYIILANSIFPPISRTRNGNIGRKYQYHGGERGSFDGFFSENDKYVRVYGENGKIVKLDSIPSWNIAHFLCDYLDDDSKSFKIASWLKSNQYWDDTTRFLLRSLFVAE